MFDVVQYYSFSIVLLSWLHCQLMIIWHILMYAMWT